MKKRYGLLIGILITVLVLFPIDGGRVCAAQAESDGGKTQIIFLLDASQSMKKEDHWTDAADSVCMISSALPEKYEAALLVYNAEIVYREDFGKIGQSTRDALEDIELGGYTSPAAALEAANAMFDADAVNKRAVFISDGEISMKEEEAAREALDSYADAVKTAAANDIKIDMFAIPDEDTPNEVLYGTKATEGEVYTVGEMQTLGELSAKYLFDLLQIERIDLGEARTVGERVTVDLQDIYMKSARILLIADDNLQDFHVVGQCESISVLQGNKTAMAKLSNPMEKQVVVDYVLENRAGVHIYLMKEYELKASIGKAYTSEDGVFEIEADIINHQGKRVLDAENLKDKVTVAVDGKPADYRVEEKRAFIPYQTTETEDIAVDVNIDPAGCMIHFTKMSGMVKLTVPIAEEEKPDYTVLWAVLGALGGALILILAVCIWKSKKNFSGQIALYLLKGEEDDDIPPCSIKLFGMARGCITFAWIQSKCGIAYKLQDADKVRFSGGKENMLCLRNSGCATIVKENEILGRGKKYFLHYGEKVLLIFNDGGTEIELHFKNIKPKER